MSKRYRLVVFDWEGTLADTLGQILNTVAAQAKRLQFGELDETLARRYVELGLVAAIKKLFPHLSRHQQEQLLQAVQEALMMRPTAVCLFAGVKNMLEQIQQAGIDIAIATNMGQLSLQRVLQTCDLNKLITVTRSAGQAPPKPFPQMLEEIIQVFNAPVDQTLMVGDSVCDIEMAKKIAVDAVGMDFYHQQATSLQKAGAMEVFDDYKQLLIFLGIGSE